jgi:purine-binding chemotaxis protein CheW
VLAEHRVDSERPLDAVEVERELQRRAAALAAAGKLEVVQAKIELIGFALGSQRCALETSCVVEVRRPCELTRLPGAPGHWLGVTNLRGDILPVFDLGDLLGLGRSAPSERTRMLVLGEAEPELAVQVDAVFQIESVAESEVLDPAGSGFASGLDFVRGVTRDALVVLNGAALLADPQLQIGDADQSTTREGAVP